MFRTSRNSTIHTQRISHRLTPIHAPTYPEMSTAATVNNTTAIVQSPAAVSPPASRVHGFTTAPTLTDVEDDDKPLLELVGVVVLDSQRPLQAFSQWTVDTYPRHYCMSFDLLPTAGPVTLALMQLCKELNYVRIQSVFVCMADGHLQLVVQVAKANNNHVVVEEQIIHIARVTRIEHAQSDLPFRKRARVESAADEDPKAVQSW